ncbi:MAG: polymerase III subunit gamma and tau protein [Parcubacteria group bacterium GW2011_GWA1_44_13]|uniref:Polymerase III subunit gamma and tau protein n=1 Tax=Candidatus Nomurabacteria bacterium GW2011_GWB1_44_12 TaxID=1618748 RepID=A0A837IB55_9BACT|nr:MAG: polymerase III subunit gamma and tau protein [Candidatus Nomurabacteria bacterium GW2011_GWB1_44_12]KKT38182.1 MAG: polymerase III subunit gamma and tau protein [Parcubacteria group bacterium GW2011_GWA1_44_13]KKT59578.1 MAG: polymerase III subunit gamma and tau protein [Parcubacteria group bacterium GW2011_GWC1_44_26]HBB43841.1 hypothetical protein [Candidatus Yonathbacteria bacterium]
MFDFFEHYKKTGYLHHAHVIVGAYDTVSPALVSALARHLNIETKGNPDLMERFYETLGIDEARELKDAQTRAGFDGARKIFVIGAESFTHQAQNALLKTFEEPTAGTHFFIILPRAEMLLPTLRSRVLVVSGNIANTDDSKELAEKFLDATLEGRFVIAKKMAEKKAGETVDREQFRGMLDHIERILYTRTAGKRDDATANIFREIFQAKTYLSNPGSSPKMLLEHIALVLPN